MPRMTSTMRKMLPFLALVFLIGGGCDDKKNRKKIEKPILSPIPKFRPMKTQQRISQKKEMKEMAKVTDEMRRRAMGGIGMDGPVRKMLVQIKKLPQDHYPATYRSFVDDLKDRLGVLRKTTRYKRDYNALIESCLACHRIYAPQVVISIENLEIK